MSCWLNMLHLIMQSYSIWRYLLSIIFIEYFIHMSKKHFGFHRDLCHIYLWLNFKLNPFLFSQKLFPLLYFSIVLPFIFNKFSVELTNCTISLAFFFLKYFFKTIEGQFGYFFKKNSKKCNILPFSWNATFSC